MSVKPTSFISKARQFGIILITDTHTNDDIFQCSCPTELPLYSSAYTTVQKREAMAIEGR